MAQSPVARLRTICLSLPEVEERMSHGEPAWFIARGKQFVSLDDHHHGADHLAFWCASPEGMQSTLVDGDPARYFVPPYGGHRGWIGVRLDRSPDWRVIEDLVFEAYLTVAPKGLTTKLQESSSDPS